MLIMQLLLPQLGNLYSYFGADFWVFEKMLYSTACLETTAFDACGKYMLFAVSSSSSGISCLLGSGCITLVFFPTRNSGLRMYDFISSEASFLSVNLSSFTLV